MQEKYLQENKDRFLEELIELLKIPSVSADPSFAKDVRNAAEFIAVKMKDAGIENVSVDETAGYPVVYGDKMIDESLPTILVYGHYDVQPADPIELWNSPPFEPVIKDGYIYARGASDDKGQMYMHIKAYEMMIQTNTLPCNVKFMIEGEEEAGSNNLEPYVKANTEKLACDIVLVSDTGMIANDVPTITTGIRGMSYVEVEVVGPNRDLHSGMYGGAVANPLNILSKMIASLHNEKGEIMIPGFYDNVVDVSAAERETMAQAPFSLTEYKDHLDIEAVYGEEGFSTLERVSIRPTLDVNGMWGGYIGDGAKTVLPSKAHAKISMRLVPNQNSDRITKLFV
jgi:acetylornithine deacetylase/succinyl-diaminopimelate desuccinylase-like protein